MATANTFTDKAQRFVDVLDEIYKQEALTALLEASGVEYVGAHRVRIPRISLDAGADYDRVKGYVDGAVTVEYDDVELAFDRGRRFRIDVVDNDESAFNLYRAVATEYVRSKEIPEIDAVRFMRLAQQAETVENQDITAANALDAFDAAEMHMTDAEVAPGDFVMYVSAEYYKAMKNDPKIAHRLLTNTTGDVNRSVCLLDGQIPVIRVPKTRFYDTVQLKDGVTAGQTEGGYSAIAGTSRELNFVLLPRSAAEAITKRRISKIILPEENQQADAYDIPYRTHHDLIVRHNRKKGIYVSRKSKAVTG